ncbi:MAG: hypothetical protein DLM56_12155 [Pseudonocardiales bacterium]|nr:MAG: hypothetical protein DLM56_12155 [Pseudonocardiales bacterium]
MRVGRLVIVVSAAVVGVLIGAVIALTQSGSASDKAAPPGTAQHSIATTSAAPTTVPPTTARTSQSPAPPPSPTPPPIVAPVPVTSAQAASLPQATTWGRVTGGVQDPAPTTSTDGTVVHPEHAVPVYAAPGGAAIAMLPDVQVGTPTWLPVIARAPGWDRVLLPAKPNGVTGWLYDAGGALSTAHTPWEIHVDLASFRLTVYKDGREEGSWSAGFGLPDNPTPPSRTFILSSFTDPDQTYSPVIVPLGVHSAALDTFGGGPGTVAIHTWPSSDVFGTLSSNGCIRIPADGLDLVEKVPFGSIVIIQ